MTRARSSMAFLLLLLIAAGCTTMPAQTASVPAPATPGPAPTVLKSTPDVVTLDSPSPMISIKLMVRAGSTSDPRGREGLAALVADALIEGGFGDPANPVTKERLAEITQPWGQGAMPRSQTAGRTTTFHIQVPRDVLPEYLERVLLPMFTRPLFLAEEIDRLKNEASALVSSYRYENLENLGLAAVEELVLKGTAYEHQPFGTETSLPALTRADVLNFYRESYRPGRFIIGVSTSDDEVVGSIVEVVRQIPAEPGARAMAARAGGAAGSPESFQGRQAVVIVEPNAPAASVHLGFPLSINRTDPDFWPLYVANTWLGTHRDSFGRLYQQIRQERGYNYGDYSYIEHWNGRPFSLFQIFNQPREQQYFSIWIRPVQHEYAVHLTRAANWELERLVRHGLTDEQVEAAKKKARVLYLNLAETVDRLLAARMDDVFYGMRPGFLEGYLRRIDAVTTTQVNQAIRRHLQTQNVKYVIVTDEAHAAETVNQLGSDEPVYGKTLADYQLEQVELSDGVKVWQIPEEKIEMLRVDALWAHYPLKLNPDAIRRVPVTSLFRTGDFIAAGQ